MEFTSSGYEVVDFLQELCSNDVDIGVGQIAHTGMQNKRGGYENDCSLVRLAPNRYLLVGPTEQQSHCMSWVNKHLKDNRVQVRDVTTAYTALCLMGPYAKSLLSEVVSERGELESFPFFTFKELDIGLATQILVCNLTHTGEAGFTIYIPNEYALHVYDTIIKSGKKYGLRHAGSIAMRLLRIEKFYAFWGQVSLK